MQVLHFWCVDASVHRLLWLESRYCIGLPSTKPSFRGTVTLIRYRYILNFFFISLVFLVKNWTVILIKSSGSFFYLLYSNLALVGLQIWVTTCHIFMTEGFVASFEPYKTVPDMWINIVWHQLEKVKKTSRPVNVSWVSDWAVMNCPAQEQQTYLSWMLKWNANFSTIYLIGKKF
jgi:hypothetical protein